MTRRKYKKYEFLFCGNKMYSCETLKRVRWYNKLFYLSAHIILWRCSIVTDLGYDEALEMAKCYLNEDGFYEQIMGQKL